MAVIAPHRSTFQGDSEGDVTLFQVIHNRKKERDNKKNKQIEAFKAALRKKKCS